MLRQPRRTPQSRRFKFKKKVVFVDRSTQHFTGIIKMNKSIKLFWYNFEAIRLQLVWAMSKRRKFSRKMFFKHKMAQKTKNKEVIFRWTKKKKKKKGKVWYIGFPHILYTLKPKGSRMGKGKGSSAGYYYKAKPGQNIIFISRCSLPKLNFALYKATKTIPGSIATINKNYKSPNLKWN